MAHIFAQVTPSLIRAIKADYRAGVFGVRSCAGKHNVSVNTARNIIHERSTRYAAMDPTIPKETT